MKKFILSVLVFSIIGISCLSVFAGACLPSKSLETTSPHSALPSILDMAPNFGRSLVVHDIPELPKALKEMDSHVVPQPSTLSSMPNKLSQDGADIPILPNQSDSNDELSILPQKVRGEIRGADAQRAAELLGNFNYKVSPAYKLIRKCFGNINHEKSIDLVIKVQQNLEKKGIFLPKLSRDEKRRKALLYKYIQKYLHYIGLVLLHVQL
ncbi:MAG: hypothetical protein IJ758_02070 [Clostridia bacterium]|nr:hypothetical protein [Clostridia bacterium]